MRPPAGPQVMASKCSTCVFRPGDLMHLGSERLRELIEANRAAGAALICHQTLEYGSHPEVGETVCRGFWDAYRGSTRSILAVEAMFGPDAFVEVEPPG